MAIYTGVALEVSVPLLLMIFCFRRVLCGQGGFANVAIFW